MKCLRNFSESGDAKLQMPPMEHVKKPGATDSKNYRLPHHKCDILGRRSVAFKRQGTLYGVEGTYGAVAHAGTSYTVFCDGYLTH